VRVLYVCVLCVCVFVCCVSVCCECVCVCARARACNHFKGAYKLGVTRVVRVCVCVHVCM